MCAHQPAALWPHASLLRLGHHLHTRECFLEKYEYEAYTGPPWLRRAGARRLTVAAEQQRVLSEL